MRILIAAVVVGVAGCAGVERVSESRFEPLSAQEFKYETRFGLAFPLDGGGEEKRREMLEGWLSENDRCKGGYVITERLVSKAGEAFGQPFGRVVWHGRCK